MMIRWRPILAVGVSLFVASCASKERAPDSAPAQETSAAEASGDAVTEADRERRRDRNVDKSERQQVGVADLVRTNNQLAFDLYGNLRADDFVFSPHGIASTLAVVYAGADGSSAEQVSRTMRAAMGERDVHAKFRQLHDELRQREKPKSRDARGLRLRVVTGVWHATDVDPRSKFLRVAGNDQLAHVQAIDFSTQPADALAEVNKFVSDATMKRVGEPLSTGEVGPLTRVVLTNSTYFDAPWTVPFERARTANLEFATPDGPEAVPTMRTIGRFSYLEGDGFQLVELPYGDGEVVASIILPTEEQPNYDANLTADYYGWMTGQARQTEVEVMLPRFTLKSRKELSSALSTMGMGAVFDPREADLGRLAPKDPNVPLYLNEVVHQARVSVDEDGSDAAAAARPSGYGGGGAEPTKFHANRPFLFVVRDLGTGAILFMARVARPG